MDFFDNQPDNSKQNEKLLDEIMQKQQERERKNVKKSYLLNRDVGTVNNPYRRNNQEYSNENEFASPDSNQTPVFIVKSNKRYTNRRNGNSKGKTVKLVISIILLTLLIASAFFCAFFFTKHEIKFVCGNMNGITITDKKGNEISKLEPRLNQTVEFKIELKDEYSNSDIQVIYNNQEIVPDVYNVYSLKYTGKIDRIRIMGVVKNVYSINFSDPTNLKFYTTDESNEYTVSLNGEEKTNFHGNAIKFKVKDTTTNKFVTEPYISIYCDDTLLTADSNQVYTVNFLDTYNITAYDSSPIEYFEFERQYRSNGTLESIQVTGLTELGKSQSTLVLPLTFRDTTVNYAFKNNEYYTNVTKIIMPAKTSSHILGETNSAWFLDRFIALENVEVTGSSNMIGWYSADGILYTRVLQSGSHSSISRLLRLPNCYGKDLPEGARVVTINPDNIASRAFERVMYIKTIKMGNNVKVIEPYAFKSSVTHDLTFQFENNTNFKVENNIIYTYDGKTIVSAQFAKGEFHVKDGMEVSDNAFSNSEITTLIFDGTAVLNDYSIADMPCMEKVVLPSNFKSIAPMTFGTISPIKVIDLRNVDSVVTIDNLLLSYTGWSGVKSIVVQDSLLENYKTKYADSPFINSLISVTEYDAQ